jgi:uncharacterized protein (TIGR02757 family)
MNDLIPTEQRHTLKAFLDRKAFDFNIISFIETDPISVPHKFSKKQDIEIAAFFSAVFAWGNRTTIIRKSTELMKRMNMAPYEFCLNHNEKDLKNLSGFKHRTFNETDLFYFIEFLHLHYLKFDSLEDAFSMYDMNASSDEKVEAILNGFYHYFFSYEYAPARTRKHIAAPEKNSTCKRLNMFLRWMVRKDNKGVDFGIWKTISPAELICPIDVHVARVAKRFKMLKRNAIDWEAAVELTKYLRQLDPIDPIKYDFALFGLGVMEKF